MAFAFFWRWLIGAKRRRPELRVIVYTRAACHLCDDALTVLQRYQQRYGFVLETVDVDESADLVRAYGDSVPVVTIDGQVRFRARVNEVLLARILDANS
jgi:glutaredoxin